ncbi:MAG: four helix bundle protein [Cyclobacteriaceae bacterium]|nr:four helix bundle protein [Cyclobacteriaceae bacterium]
MNAQDLQQRTKKFSLQIILFFQGLPKTTEAQLLGKQLLRAATSVAANYRAACRGRSKAEFIAKLSIVVEEADETLLWLELMEEAGIASVEESLKKEAKEILFIMSASRKSAKGRDNQ